MIRAAAAALIGALASAVWLAGFYTAGGGLRVAFDIDPPRLVNGFHPAERNAETGLTYAWTGAEAGLRLPGLDRRVPWSFTARVSAARPGGTPNPLLAIFVDGVQLHTHQTSSEFENVGVLVPARPERRGLTVVMRSSSTFVPGPDDRRELGVVVDSLDLLPNGLVLPPAEMFGAAMCGGAALAAAISLLGVTSGSAIGAAVLLTAGQGAVLARGFAPYTGFPQIATRLALATAIVVALGAWFVRVRQRPLRNTARFAVAFSAGAWFLELLVLMHPNMPIGDALFHAHRFQGVLAGDWYFTSIAPGGYAFPYAPGLYVVAAPFAGLVRREFGDMALLRIVTTGADAAAGLLLYYIAARAWHDRLAAAGAVAMYHLMPLSFRIVTVGNLTNAFAESLTVGAIALVTAPALKAIAGPGTLALALMLTAAFLSHTSTFAILSVCGLTSALVFAWKGGAALRSPAKAIAVATLCAILLAVVSYYAHFIETYRTELARLGTETATAAPDAGGRGTFERAAAVPRYLSLYLGLPGLALAALGGVDRWRRRSRDRLTLTIVAWVGACTLFLLVGVVTPLDMRHYLAVIPAIALLAACGAAWLWREPGLPRLAAAGLLGWMLWIGVDTWWTTLG